MKMMMLLSAFVRGTLAMILYNEIVHCIVVEQSERTIVQNEVRISICTVSIPIHFIGPPLDFLQLSRPEQFTTDLQQKKLSDNVVS